MREEGEGWINTWFPELQHVHIHHITSVSPVIVASRLARLIKQP